MNQEIDLGIKTFAMNDQLDMARWSGDFNPMHVDVVAARRLLTGSPVVHGMHLVLEALARWSVYGGTSFAALGGEFSKPVSVGDCVSFFAQQQDGKTVLLARVDGITHMMLTLTVELQSATWEGLPPGERLEWGNRPIEEPPAHWLDRTCALPEIEGTLPAANLAASIIGMQGAIQLGQLSTLVGMACPGLHSIFASFVLTKRETISGGRFRAQLYDSRFKLLRITVDGAWCGEVRAFVRAAPQQQPPMQEVIALVEPGLPAGHRTWVLGGSRGLGEIAAKVAAAAGSEVTLTYASGLDDAHRVADEINSADRGRASVARYSVGDTEIRTLCSERTRPLAILYFATPRIARRRAQLFEPARLREFLEVYAEEPARLALALEHASLQHRSPAPVRFFFPSSTYIDELPSGMVEYAMAKAAAEVMAQDLNKRLRYVQVKTTRLPKLLTDQTAGITAEAGPSALAVVALAIQEALGCVPSSALSGATNASDRMTG